MQLNDVQAMKLLCTEPAPKLKEPGKFTDLFHAFIGLCLQKEADKRPSAVELLTVRAHKSPYTHSIV